MGQGLADRAIAQGWVASTLAAYIGRTVSRIDLVEENIGKFGPQGRSGYQFDVGGIAQHGDGGFGQFGNHIHLTGLEGLHQRIGIAKALKNYFIDLGFLPKVIRVRREMDILVLDMLDQPEGAAADHRGILKFLWRTPR